jgi:hypothetical protein
MARLLSPAATQFSGAKKGRLGLFSRFLLSPSSPALKDP